MPPADNLDSEHRREAESVDERSSIPATERQIAVLRFFDITSDGMSIEEASRRIDQLFEDPEKKEKWEATRDDSLQHSPATEAQLFRLGFAAKRLGKRLPRSLSKFEACRLIDKWYGKNEDLEFEYREAKEARIAEEMEFAVLMDKIEENCDLYNLPALSLSEETVRNALREMGERRPKGCDLNAAKEVLKHIVENATSKQPPYMTFTFNVPEKEPFEGKVTSSQRELIWQLGCHDGATIDQLGERQAAALIRELKKMKGIEDSATYI